VNFVAFVLSHCFPPPISRYTKYETMGLFCWFRTCPSILCDHFLGPEGRLRMSCSLFTVSGKAKGHQICTIISRECRHVTTAGWAQLCGPDCTLSSVSAVSPMYRPERGLLASLRVLFSLQPRLPINQRPPTLLSFFLLRCPSHLLNVCLLAGLPGPNATLLFSPGLGGCITMDS